MKVLKSLGGLRNLQSKVSFEYFGFGSTEQEEVELFCLILPEGFEFSVD